MRKLLIISILCCLSCGEEKDRSKEATDMPEPRLAEISTLCFSSITEQDSLQNGNLPDSTVLNLEIQGEMVTGTFNWIPAEKDSRRGSINATKNGEEIKGSYYVTQEGQQDTIRIQINLQDNNALVSTMDNDGTEMKLEIDKVECRE